MENQIQTVIKISKKILIKVGSNVLNDQKNLSVKKIEELAKLSSDLININKELIIVSSGAILTGRKSVNFINEDHIKYSQALSAIGQIGLINNYYKEFEKRNILIAQILLSLNDLSEKKLVKNVKDTLNVLLNKDVVPIINENDTTATDEISFGDNDILASKIATLFNFDLVIFLSDIDGIYDDEHKLIKTIKPSSLTHIEKNIDLNKKLNDKNVGSGGIKSKIKAMKEISKNKKSKVFILNGKKKLSLDSLYKESKFTLLQS